MYIRSLISYAFFASTLVSAAPLNSSGSVVDTTSNVMNTVSNTASNVSTVVSNTLGQVQNVTGNGLIPTVIDSQELLDTTLDNIRREITEIDELQATFAGLLQAVINAYVPTSIPDALNRINSIIGNATNGITFENVAQLLLNGASISDLTQNVLAGYGLSNINSYMNYNNPVAPNQIYPKSSQDAPYNVPERDLRAAVYFSPGFTFSANSKKRPILFVPGTGAYGGVNFISNLGKLLGQDPRYDLAYLNVPGAMYNDTQVNSEYIAYAMNYISSLTGNKGDVAVIAWSQGNPDTQWAFQYWPSTRNTTSDFISASADFHGTVLAYFLDPAFPNVVPNPPSIIQQEYDSNFISVLRAGGGGSPYVPSTSVWSITDEIVQPQFDPDASAHYEPVPNPPYCPSNNTTSSTSSSTATSTTSSSITTSSTISTTTHTTTSSNTSLKTSSGGTMTTSTTSSKHRSLCSKRPKSQHNSLASRAAPSTTTSAVVVTTTTPAAATTTTSQSISTTASTVASTADSISSGQLQGSGRYAFTNNQIQTICAGRPAGGIYTHEGVLYNPLMYALVLDALENDGPGQVSRLNLDVVCNELVAPGLSVADVLATEGLIPLAALNLLLYPQKVLQEPPIMPYALKPPVARSCSD